MYLFCIFILLIGSIGTAECNYMNKNSYKIVFRKSKKHVLGLRKTIYGMLSQSKLSGRLQPRRLGFALVSGFNKRVLCAFYSCRKCCMLGIATAIFRIYY